jgi:hypothetical protein
LDDPADADAFVGDPVDPVLAHLRPPKRAVMGEILPVRRHVRYARMMQADDLPLIVEDRRSRRAGRGIGLIVQKVG